VPLDYFNGTYPGETVSIAITKLPAKVPVDDPHYGGPILINPGGPGGAGAGFTIVVGKGLQTITDPPWTRSGSSTRDAKYYDIIGFDPRGIGETEPLASCLPDIPSTWTWTLREAEEGILGSSDAALGRLWSKTHAWGASCKANMEAQDGPSILPYMATAFVARDMLEIVEKHATYVAQRLDALKSSRKSQSPCSKPDPAVYIPSESKLNYWGFSYGSFLGNTFASMYPDRVGRFAVDAIVSAYDYRHSLGNGSLTDTEKAFRSFYTFCLSVGPRACPLAKAGSTLEDVEKRVQAIIQSLYHNPIPVVSANGPEIISYSDLKSLLFSGTYIPGALWPVLSEILVEVEARGGAYLNLIFGVLSRRHMYTCPANGSLPVRPPTVDATIAILCSDGIDQSSVDIDQFTTYWDMLESISPTAGSIWAGLMLRCAGWKVKASHSFKGPFGRNTSNPILFISNTADPVTPLRSARLTHGLYPNSGLLISDHAGHSSLSNPHPCLLDHINRYFQAGELPVPGTLCIPPTTPLSLNSTDPKSPFYDPSLESESVARIAIEIEDYTAYDWELSRVGDEISRAVLENNWLGLGDILGGEKVQRVMQFAANQPGSRWALEE